MKKLLKLNKSILSLTILLLLLVSCCLIFSACGEEPASQDERKVLSYSMIQEIEEVFYNGERLEPEVVLMDGETPLVKGVDYQLTYANNIEPGTGIVYITGIGKYRQTVQANFTILASFQEKLNTMAPGETISLGQNYTGNLTIPEGVILKIESRSVVYLEGQTTLLEDAQLINGGTIVVRSGATLNLGVGALTNDGQITVAGFLVEGEGGTLNNNGTITLNGGEVDISNALENQGTFSLTFGSVFNIDNLKMLNLAQQIIQSSSVSENTIRLNNNLDLDGGTLSIGRNNTLDMQGYLLSNGTIENRGTICVQSYFGLISALSYCKGEGMVKLSGVSQIALTNILTVPAGVSLYFEEDISISSSDPELYYINVQGQIVGQNNVQINLLGEKIIVGASNIFYGDVMFVNVREGIYYWNQSSARWNYIPQV